jgi:hypothetical protein
MDGVIDRGTTQRRRSVREDDEDDQPSERGSILENMARARAAKLRSTNAMLRQADSMR